MGREAPLVICKSVKMRDFKSNDFVRVDSKGLTDAFFVRVHSKGLTDANAGSWGVNAGSKLVEIAGASVRVANKGLRMQGFWE